MKSEDIKTKDELNIVIRSDFGIVKYMYNKFGFTEFNEDDTKPVAISKATATFRIQAIVEELRELIRAYDANDMAGIADALVDLSVFVLGTAALHNLPWPDLFEEVMRANLSKEVGEGKKKRNTTQGIDLIKPKGWKGPDIKTVLKNFGWEE